jgi:acyl-CoA thioesterase-1
VRERPRISSRAIRSWAVANHEFATTVHQNRNIRHREETVSPKLSLDLILACLRRLSYAVVLATAMLAAAGAVQAEPVRIVAFGASDLGGSRVDGRSWAEQLKGMLAEKGFDVSLTISPFPYDTSAGLLARVDQAVPAGTHIVVFSNAGINDKRRGVPLAETTANTGTMKLRIRARGAIPILVRPGLVPSQFKQDDGLHPNAKGNELVAAKALSQVIEAIRQLKTG